MQTVHHAARTTDTNLPSPRHPSCPSRPQLTLESTRSSSLSCSSWLSAAAACSWLDRLLLGTMCLATRRLQLALQLRRRLLAVDCLSGCRLSVRPARARPPSARARSRAMCASARGYWAGSSGGVPCRQPKWRPAGPPPRCRRRPAKVGMAVAARLPAGRLRQLLLRLAALGRAGVTGALQLSSASRPVSAACSWWWRGAASAACSRRFRSREVPVARALSLPQLFGGRWSEPSARSLACSWRCASTASSATSAFSADTVASRLSSPWRAATLRFTSRAASRLMARVSSLPVG